jgi:DNA-binding GntR family transcriptional regulator
MSKESLKTQAYQIIKQKILDCEFLPGTLMNENYLCQILSISRTPVRDAISRLEHEGLVQITPPKGFLVKEITLRDLNAYFETRCFLELYTLTQYGKNTDKHELDIFLHFFQEYDSFSNPEDFYRISASLHNIFVEESSNPYFMQTYEQLSDQEQRIRKLIPLDPDCIHLLRESYTILLNYCIKEDWSCAADTLAHILDIYKDYTFSSFLSGGNPSERNHNEQK